MALGWHGLVARSASETRLTCTRGPALGAAEQNWDFEYLVLEGHNQPFMLLSQEYQGDGSDPPPKKVSA